MGGRQYRWRPTADLTERTRCLRRHAPIAIANNLAAASDNATPHAAGVPATAHGD